MQFFCSCNYLFMKLPVYEIYLLMQFTCSCNLPVHAIYMFMQFTCSCSYLFKQFTCSCNLPVPKCTCNLSVHAVICSCSYLFMQLICSCSLPDHAIDLFLPVVVPWHRCASLCLLYHCRRSPVQPMMTVV